MKRKTMIAAALAAALVVGAGIGPAWSYFTSTSAASGSLPIKIEPTTTITEEYGSGEKKVVIHNLDTSEIPVFVRVAVYSSMDTEVSGNGWSGADDGVASGKGWYYYNDPLEVGQDTSELSVKIPEFPITKSDTEPNGETDGANYAVIVVYESTPVKYDKSGKPYADWTLTLNSKSSEGGE
ncbi:MAG: hypothetical protein IKG11_00180 [Atopobiaceae bacterium]|nr:hypothetical protein [Atopobiaceae bacterium]MDO4403839.1 hypothetical protein [Atopobiaceae bacterium]